MTLSIKRAIARPMPMPLAFALLAIAMPGTAGAVDYGQYPAPNLGGYPRSVLSGRCIVLRPYGPLPIRIYTTPQGPPYYNVPPYPVVAPY